jgi:hypothetical protein
MQHFLGFLGWTMNIEKHFVETPALADTSIMMEEGSEIYVVNH